MYLLSPLALNDHWLIVFIIRTVFKRRDADQLYICAGGHNVSEGAAAERIHCCDSRVSSWVVKKSFGRLHTFHTHLGFNKRPYHWEANSGVFGSVPQVFSRELHCHSRLSESGRRQEGATECWFGLHAVVQSRYLQDRMHHGSSM